jgi:hypothetical protein
MPKWPIDEVEDPSSLTDTDWAELNKLRAAYERGGSRAASKAVARLSAEDPVGCVRLLGALFPEMIRERIKDALAARGITESDLLVMLEEAERKMQSPSPAKH